jgi:hypothetical protein
LGNEFIGKRVENPSDEKPKDKPSERPQPKPKPKPIRFQCEYCGRDGPKHEFCFKRKREERLAKEWPNKDKYHPSNGVLEPRMLMPRAKAIVRTVMSCRHRRMAGGAVGRASMVRPVQTWALVTVVFVVVEVLGSSLLVVVQVVCMVSLMVFSLLGVLHLVHNTMVGGVVGL